MVTTTLVPALATRSMAPPIPFTILPCRWEMETQRKVPIIEFEYEKKGGRSKLWGYKVAQTLERHHCYFTGIESYEGQAVSLYTLPI